MSRSILVTLLMSVSRSQVIRDYKKFLTTFLGVALGVAVYCGMTVSTDSVLRAFDYSEEALTAKLDLVISPTSGEIAEEILPTLSTLPFIASLHPLSSVIVPLSADSTLTAPSNGTSELGTFEIRGIDIIAQELPKDAFATPSRDAFFELLKDPAAVLITYDLMTHLARHQHQRGITLPRGEGELQSEFYAAINGRLKKLRAVGVIRIPGQKVIMDISHFQGLIERYGSVQQLGVTLTPNFAPHAAVEQLTQALGSSYSIGETNPLALQAERMSASFRLCLTLLSSIVLTVGVLLVYQTVSHSVLRRREELSVLHTLGVPSSLLGLSVIIESLVLGGIASSVGVALGFGISILSTEIIEQTFQVMYIPTTVTTPSLSLGTALRGLILGLGVSFVGSVIPAYTIHSSYGNRRSYLRNELSRGLLTLASAMGVLLLGLALAVAEGAIAPLPALLTYTSPIILVLGSFLLTPLLLVATLWLLKMLFFNSALMGIVTDSLRTSWRRSSLTLCAMSGSLALFIGMSSMIQSFRNTITDWIDDITPADIYISSPVTITGSPAGFIPEEVIEHMKRSAQVRDTDWITYVDTIVDGRRIKIGGIRFETLLSHPRIRFISELSRDEIASIIKDSLISGSPIGPTPVFVSEVFARRFRYTQGAVFSISTPKGEKQVRVAGIFSDYSSDQGLIYAPDSWIRSTFSESRKHTLSVYLNEGVDTQSFIKDAKEQFPDAVLVFRNREELHSEVLRLFDATFAVTKILQLITIAVACFSVINTLLMQLFERQQSLASLYAIGVSKRSLGISIVGESAILGALAALHGGLSGVALGYILTTSVNQEAFGWSLPWSFSPLLTISSASLILITTIAGGVFTAQYLQRSLSTGALRYE